MNPTKRIALDHYSVTSVTKIDRYSDAMCVPPPPPPPPVNPTPVPPPSGGTNSNWIGPIDTLVLAVAAVNLPSKLIFPKCGSSYAYHELDGNIVM